MQSSMQNQKRLFLIGSVSLNSNSLIHVVANIEQVFTKENSFYFKDVIFFSAKGRAKDRKGYEKEGIKVLMNLNEMRALSYAIKELVKTKKSSFEKISNSGIMKKIFLGYAPSKDNNEIFYINVRTFGNNPKNVSVSADKYRMIAFADSLYNLAEEVEKIKFLYERKKSEKQAK